MRAAGYYLLYFITVQHLNIGQRLHLEQKFIACPFSRVAGTTFFRTQNGKADTYMVQYFADVAGNALGALVKAAGTSHPKKDIGLFAFGGHFGHGRDFHFGCRNFDFGFFIFFDFF